MMAGLLSHALAAMAFCAILSMLLGLPAISFAIFVSGVCAMIIEQDYDELSPNRRTPIAHSVFLGVVWTVLASLILWSLSAMCVLSSENALMLTLAVVSAYSTHLAIDAATKEGIFVVPKGMKVKKWMRGLSRGDDAAWGYWRQFRIEEVRGWKVSRANEDPILNAAISLPSLLIIIALVAAMPPPV